MGVFFLLFDVFEHVFVKTRSALFINPLTNMPRCAAVKKNGKQCKQNGTGGEIIDCGQGPRCAYHKKPAVNQQLSIIETCPSYPVSSLEFEPGLGYSELNTAYDGSLFYQDFLRLAQRSLDFNCGDHCSGQWVEDGQLLRTCPGELHMTNATWTSLDPVMQSRVKGLKCSACFVPIKTLHVNSEIPLDEP
jgi:hypothetical protein